jgi:hypothetical protein
MSEQEIKVRNFKCLCGKSRMLSVIDPNGKPFSKESLKQQGELMMAGLDFEVIPLAEAQKKNLCFECELD